MSACINTGIVARKLAPLFSAESYIGRKFAVARYGQPDSTQLSLPASEFVLSKSEASIDPLTEALESLAEAADGDVPETLPRHMTQTPPEERRFVMVELIKLSMAMAAENGRLRLLGDYFTVLPDLVDEASAPLDLVLEEIQIRREAGDVPVQAEYIQRFPQFTEFLGGLLAVDITVTSASPRNRPPEPIESGESIDEFQILQTLGKGAFAHVYLAKQTSMSRLVALKVSRGTGSEPQALAQFDHPNIVRVFDQRILENPDVHLLYMQYHPGGTLHDVVGRLRETKTNVTAKNSLSSSTTISGKLLLDSVDANLLSGAQVVPNRSSIRHWIAESDWTRLVAWTGIQLAGALHEAHERGVMHRDVKPANVLLTAEGIPQLADFNVSMAGAAGRSGAASSLGGSVGYMAPEHLRAINASMMAPEESVAEQADLYSLAVLLWELWQGRRPFDCPGQANSWSDLVSDQLASREHPLLDCVHDGAPEDRVLESVLRSALNPVPDQRPASGTEMAGRLRLALHPEAAALFDPDQGSFIAWLRSRSPWFVATIAILLPNAAAAEFNYQYNSLEIMSDDTREALGRIAFWVNSIAFPIGVGLMIWFTKALAKAMEKSRSNVAPSGRDILNTLELGHRAAMIGGTVWMIAGIIYPVLLSHQVADFTATNATHFFVSLMICGAVAMTYPLFLLALACVYAYYPAMIRPTMQDPDFDARAERMIRLSESYLLIAATIPLLGAALMIFSDSESRSFLLSAVVMGMIGVGFSFFAYRKIVQTWGRLGQVLSTKTSEVPGQTPGR